MRTFHAVGAALSVAALAVPALFGSTPAVAADSEMTISHYFTGNVGLAGIQAFFTEFKKQTGITVVDSPIGHEDFKTDILVRAAGDKLPDVFSYWAGARTQFVVSAGKLAPLDELWSKGNLDSVVAKPIAVAATLYDGKRYLVPIGYHYAGLFYNPKVMAKAGVSATPTTWDELVSLCKTLKSKGVDPIAIGSKNRWPAQFWFDYILLGTAGPQYREDLMSGKRAQSAERCECRMGRATLPGEGLAGPASWRRVLVRLFRVSEINPETYGIRCHHLPTSDTGWLGGAENIPPVIDGTVLLSASDLAATEEPNAALNPYRAFQKMKPDETIDYGVMIFRGRFDMREAAATARVQNASQALRNGDDEAALQLAHEAVAIDSALPSSDTVLGDVLARMGRKDEAHEAWEDALAQAQNSNPDAQAEFIPHSSRGESEEVGKSDLKNLSADLPAAATWLRAARSLPSAPASGPWSPAQLSP